MSSKILFLLLVLLSPLVYASGGVEPNTDNAPTFRGSLSDEELSWLNKDQTLTYAYDPDWAPFEWTDDLDRHTGIIADLLEIVGRNTGITFSAIHTDTWEKSVKGVKEGKAQMFSAITHNSDREKYLNFTTNDIYTYPAVLVAQFGDKTVYLDMETDFKGKKIGIVKSSGLGRYIQKKYPALDYVEITSTDEGFRKVRSKKIDLFAINTVTARYYIEKKGFDDLKVATRLDYIYHLKIAVSKTMPPEVITILDKALSSISEEEFKGVFHKWTAVAEKSATNWKLVTQISAIFLFIILFLAWNTRMLKLAVSEKTKDLSERNAELNNALNEIKTLQGIIPICSYCHSIRDDRGAWNKIEAYLAEHSEARLSHGVCPHCEAKARTDADLGDAEK